MDVLKKFREFLNKSVPDIVIKYTSEGKKYDTVEVKRASDIYIAARLENDSFLTYPSFSRSVLQAAGLTEEEIERAGINKNNIPIEKRDKVVEFARKEVIETYEEQNDYYRTLSGLPTLDDMEEYWFDDFSIYEKYNIEPQPIHTISPDMLIVLETAGYLQPFIDKYPNKKYLQHLGLKRIDVVTARMADNFQLLYFPRFDDSDSFYRDFINYYEMCREYFLTIVYNSFYTDRYEYYDNYIAFTLLTMVINHMVSGVFKVFVSRDFYDAETTRTFLEAYGIPYDKNFSLLELKLLAKNLNILLQHKSSDKVLLDVMGLLGHTDYDLMKYYLIKQQKFDNDGSPYFVYKTEINEDGNEVQVLDKEKMYDFYFSRVKVGTHDVQSALDDESNIMRYDLVTESDAYWVEDKELREKLLNSQFNYIDTKYMDVNVIYQMHKIMFECTYLSRLILDKKETKEIEVSLLKLSMDDIPLFDVITFLICLMCKYYGIEPDFMDTASKKLYILGFNFLADFDTIKKDIQARPDIYDQRILKYINDATFTTPEDINKMYQMVKNLEVFITTAINNTEDIEAYRAYDKLYRTLLWMQSDDRNYRDENGNLPNQYTDYLKVHNVELYDKLMSYSRDDCSQMVNYITTKIMNLFSNAKYFKYLKILDISAIEALMKLLRFFKSYTVEMRDANIIILLDSRYYNTIFARTQMKMNATITIPEVDFIDDILDLIKSLKTNIRISDHPRLVHAMKLCIRYLMKSSVDMVSRDTIDKLNIDMLIARRMNVYDHLLMSHIITTKQYIGLIDQYKMHITLHGFSDKEVHDKITSMKDVQMEIHDTQLLDTFIEHISMISTLSREDKARITDFVSSHASITNKDVIDTSKSGIVGMDGIVFHINQMLDVYGALYMNNIITHKQYMNLLDAYKLHAELHPDDAIHNHHKPTIVSNIVHIDESNLCPSLKVSQWAPSIQNNDMCRISEKIKFIWED